MFHKKKKEKKKKIIQTQKQDGCEAREFLVIVHTEDIYSDISALLFLT